MASPDPFHERGNTLILSIVLGAVAIALVLTFATITELHIERKRLLALTDMAALHAASSNDDGKYYSGATSEVTLTTESVRVGVKEYLSLVPHQQMNRFHKLSVSEPTGLSPQGGAEVTLQAFIRPAYIPWGVINHEGFYIQTTSWAQNR